jgi:hypothetical protein
MLEIIRDLAMPLIQPRAKFQIGDLVKYNKYYGIKGEDYFYGIVVRKKIGWDNDALEHMFSYLIKWFNIPSWDTTFLFEDEISFIEQEKEK